jgi:hypothetical protein
MASTDDLGQKMRDALEATLPDVEVAVRRVARQRALRLARSHTSRHEAHASGWLRSITARKSAVAGGLLAALLVAFALAYGPWWTWAETESVTIGPSLARDLELRPRTSRTANAKASEQKLSDTKRATDAGGQTPVPAPPAALSKERSLPAARALLAPSPSAAPSDADARWARVTESMRKGDWEAAKLALAPLSASGDPETKDSARLLRIRIELVTSESQTLEPKWEAELSELARSGSTSSIRASARRMLESSSGAPNSDQEGELPQ